MSEPQIKNVEDAQALVKQRLQNVYGKGIEVSFSKTVLETRVRDGRRLWAVEGNAGVRRRLFWKKTWHFAYYIDADAGKICIMRGRRI